MVLPTCVGDLALTVMGAIQASALGKQSGNGSDKAESGRRRKRESYALVVDLPGRHLDLGRERVDRGDRVPDIFNHLWSHQDPISRYSQARDMPASKGKVRVLLSICLVFQAMPLASLI